MIDIEEAEAGPAIADLLQRQIEVLCRGHRGITPALITDIHALCEQYSRRAKREGIDFPPMRVLALQSANALELVRADLEPRAIETVIVNTATKYPGLDMMELAVAVQAAFPNYKGRPLAIPR